MDKKKFFNDELPVLKPVQIIEHEVTEDRFIKIFNQVHGEDGNVAYEREKFYFSKILTENPDLAECTPLSLFSVFLDVATKGLSLENSSKPLCYITFRSIKKKGANGDKDTWEKRALLDISGYGELVLRQRAGHVKYADNPEVVYEGEEVILKNTPDGVQIYHTIKLPRPKTPVALIYVRIVRSDGSVTFGTLDPEGIERLKDYSAKNNGKWDNNLKQRIPGEANHLYSDIGFLKAKCLKHAFQSFPKLKLSSFSTITEEESHEELGLSLGFHTEPVELPEIETTVNDNPPVTIQGSNGQAKGTIIEDNDNIF